MKRGAYGRKLFKDGRFGCRSNPCGVWVEETKSFCEERSFCYRRCRAHYFALQKTEDGDIKKSMWYSFNQMTRGQREAALDSTVPRSRDHLGVAGKVTKPRWRR